MKVMKFGGSCLQSRAGILRMIELVREETRPLTIVLSALKGVTDELIGMMTAAEQGSEVELTELRRRHREALESLSLSARARTEDDLGRLFDELARILGGIAALREIPPSTRDRVLSFGERLSTVLACAHLAAQGLPAQRLVADEAGIFTTREPGDARILARSREAVLERFGSQADLIYVVAGFVGRDLDGRLTTLGRGGSDTTATYLAAILGGPAILWKDAAGLLTGDPHVVAQPQVIRSLHYLDALELAHYGLPAIAAKAIHPARRAGVPIEIRSFLGDSEPSIIGEVQSSHLALSCVPQVVMIDLIGAGRAMASELENSAGELAEPRPGRILGALARFLEALAEAAIAPLALTEASPSGETTVVVRAADRPRVEAILARLHIGLEVDIRGELAAVSLIGSSMRGKIGFAARVFDVLAAQAVNIEAIAQTASERNILVIVAAQQAQTAVRALHERFVEQQ